MRSRNSLLNFECVGKKVADELHCEQLWSCACGENQSKPCLYNVDHDTDGHSSGGTWESLLTGVCNHQLEVQRQPNPPGKHLASLGSVLGTRPEGITLPLFQTLAHPFLEPFVQFWTLYLRKVESAMFVYIYIYTHNNNDVKAGESALRGQVKRQGLFGEQKAVRGCEQGNSVNAELIFTKFSTAKVRECSLKLGGDHLKIAKSVFAHGR